MSRTVLVPVDHRCEVTLHVADWYSANLKLPGDRLVFVSVLVPGDDYDGGGGSVYDSELSIASVEDLAAASPIEATMERQLAESCRREERLVAELKARGCATFRYIHAFGRGRAETLARIACEQRARVLLATYDAIAADCWDLGSAFRVFKRARLALQLVPEPPQQAGKC